MRSFASLPTSLVALLAAVSSPLVSAGELIIDETKLVNCSRPSQDGDDILVHYKGTLKSTGEEFDQSYNRGEPFKFTLGAHQVIAGWDQGLLDMCPGEERKLTVPPELGYGVFGREPVIPGNSTLIFETKLVEIVGVSQEDIQVPAVVKPTRPQVSVSSSAAAGITSLSASASVSAPANVSDTLVVQASSSGVPWKATNPAAHPQGAVSTAEPAFGIATAPPTPPTDDNVNVDDQQKEQDIAPLPTTNASPQPTSASSPLQAQEEEKKAECRLLGPFALLVQGALGLMALLTLVYKRWRETPKRPWKIFFFDVSKQVFGSMLTHVLNLAMSMLGSVDMVNSAAMAAEKTAKVSGDYPNPCSFYLLNLAIDTTIGIPILYLLLKVLHGLFLYTPLAKPPQSIKSGNYDNPPRTAWWFKQLIIYFIGLTGMKMFVWLLFALLPWLPWIGDWALRWTKGNTILQVTFAMFVFPLAMNAVQYWVIDNFIMDKSRANGGAGSGDGPGYERVHGDDDDDDDDDDSDFRDARRYDVETAEQIHPKDADASAVTAAPPISEVYPPPLTEAMRKDEANVGKKMR